MIEIKLKEGQTGYDAVGDYIRKHWEHHDHGDVIISLAISYDGIQYYYSKEIASPYGFDDIEYLSDWWEGEKFIKLFWIKSVDELEFPEDPQQNIQKT